TGSFFNLVLPSTIGGDAYRIADIGRDSARTVNTLASLLADLLTESLRLSAYGLAFPFVSPPAVSAWKPRLLVLPSLAFVLLMGAGFMLWEQRLLRRATTWMPSALRAPALRILDKLLASMRAYASRPAVWIWSMLISFAF